MRSLTMDRSRRLSAFPRCGPGALILCALLFHPSDTAAQSIAWGSLSGGVVDELGDPISDVELRIYNPATGSVRSVLSSRGGNFRLDGVTPGVYELTAEAIGYRPRVVLSVPVRPGEISTVRIVLVPERPPVVGRDTTTFVGPAGSWLVAGSVHSLGTPELSTLPDQGRTLADVLGFAPGLSEGLAGEGLSARHGELYLDGLPFRVARHPTASDSEHLFISLPRSSLSIAEVLFGDPEIEWAGGAGPIVSAFTRSSGSERSVRVFGDWHGAGLWSHSDSDGDVPGNHSIRAGAVADLPLAPEGPLISVGAEAARLQALRAPAGVPAQQVPGLDVAPFGEVWMAESTRASGFGRLDWKLDRNSAVFGRVVFGTVLEPEGPWQGAPIDPGHPMSTWGSDVSVAGAYAGEIQNRIRVEARVGFDRSTRTFAGAQGRGIPFPWTRFTGSGLALGTDPALPAEVTWQTLHASPVFYLDYDEHQFKVGGYFGVPDYTYDYTFNGTAEIFTHDAESLAGGQGIYSLTDPAGDMPDFRMQRFGVFAGDVWQAMPDVRVKVGARYDVDQLPEGWRRNVLWDSLSTRPRPDLPTELQGISGRAAVEWDAGPTTVVRASAGIHYQPTDPALVAAVLYEDGDVRVRHGENGLLVWPEMVNGPINFFAPRLTFLGEDFENPRSLRLSGGVSRALAEGVTGHIWGVLRRGESLTRRRDLNRLAGPTGQDQDGRPLYGALFKRQGVIGPTWPGNRRIQAFEHVFAMESDGWSEYLGLGVALERRSGAPLRWFASYTLSRTEDNLVGGSSSHPLAQLNPFQGTELAERWASARSDFDVPHRLAVGVEWDPPAVQGVSLGARYLMSSGRTYTAGFRQGTDVNGDGSAFNDPAFVGTTAGASPGDGCSAENVDGFAVRNGCRGPLRHSLDARVTISRFRVAGQRLEIMVDGLNLLDVEPGPRDGAALLIERDTPIAAVGSQSQIPYVANPSFGELLSPTGPGRWFRLGVRLTGDG